MGVERDGSKRSIKLLLKWPNKIDVLYIEFNGVKEEKAELYIKNGVAKINTNIPPVDVIETFENEHDLYRFGGYVNNKPWAVWEFVAESYELST